MFLLLQYVFNVPVVLATRRLGRQAAVRVRTTRGRRIHACRGSRYSAPFLVVCVALAASIVHRDMKSNAFLVSLSQRSVATSSPWTCTCSRSTSSCNRCTRSRSAVARSSRATSACFPTIDYSPVANIVWLCTSLIPTPLISSQVASTPDHSRCRFPWERLS